MKQLLVGLMISCAASFTAARGQEENTAILDTLTSYAAAIQNKDISEVQRYVDTSDALTIFEGKNVNRGWQDYRDNHLDPEFEEILELKHSFKDIEPLVLGRMAYATFTIDVIVKMVKQETSGELLATAVLTRQSGRWRIRHLHTSLISKHEH